MKMTQNNIIFIHGLESSGTGFKARLLKENLPTIITPSFILKEPGESYKELLTKRMTHLRQILNSKEKWIIIGSSFGGLMGTLYTLNNPDKVIKLILLAPFLSERIIDLKNLKPVNIPVEAYHGKSDDVVPYSTAQVVANEIFSNLKYNIVDDDHFLHSTVLSLNWKELISPK